MSRTTEITPEKIMQLTNNGRDIFEWELGNIPRKNIISPLRYGDDSPSFQVKQSSSGIWIAKDYGGNQWSGNAISFVQERYALSFPEAMNKIIEDLGFRKKSKEYKSVIKNISSIKKESNYVPFIEFNEIPFTKEGAAYWNSYHLPTDFIKANNVFQVGLWAIDKKIQQKTEGEVTFVYWAEDIKKAKILRIGPNVSKGDKWRSGMHNSYLWSYFKYKGSVVDNLFIAKSYKDELVLRYLGHDVISLQSENSRVLLESGNADKINNIAINKYLTLGADKQGWLTSYEITKATGWDYFNIGRTYYKREGLEDPADFVKEYGIDPLDSLIKMKLNK